MKAEVTCILFIYAYICVLIIEKEVDMVCVKSLKKEKEE
jgi:hypothetical protein